MYNEHPLSFDEAESHWLECIDELSLEHQLTQCNNRLPVTLKCELFLRNHPLPKPVAVGLGKGINFQQCQLSSQYEALEHYLTLSHSKNIDFPHICLSYNQVKQSSLNTLENFWEENFFEQVPLDHPLTWLEFYNYRRPEQKYYMPLALFNADYLKTPHNRDNLNCDNMFYFSSNSGSAIGANFDEALVHAIGEIIERDSWSHFLKKCFLYNTDPVKLIKKTTMPKKLQQLIVDIQVCDNTQLVVYDLNSTVKGFYAYGAQFLNYDNRCVPYYGYGCSINPQFAAQRAILEAKQIKDSNECMTNDDFYEQFKHVLDFPELMRCVKSDILNKIEEKNSINISLPQSENKYCAMKEIKEKVLSSLKDSDIYIHNHQIFKNGVSHLIVFLPNRSQFCAVQNGYPCIP